VIVLPVELDNHWFGIVVASPRQLLGSSDGKRYFKLIFFGAVSGLNTNRCCIMELDSMGFNRSEERKNVAEWLGQEIKLRKLGQMRSDYISVDLPVSQYIHFSPS